jgi:hypothetical protein
VNGPLLPFRRHIRVVLRGALLLFAGVACGDHPTASSADRLGKLDVAPALTAAASDAYHNLLVFGLELDNVRLQLKRQSGEVVTDTAITLSVDQNEVRIDIVVPLRASEERMRATVELRAANIVFFSGAQDIVVRSGQPTSPPAAISLDYVGPDAAATTLSVAPSIVSLLTSDSVAFLATALDANQQPVTLQAVDWSIRDAALGAVNPAGLFKPALLRGETFVVAKLPTGLKDSARVSIIPLPSQIEVVSGSEQSGLVGTVLGTPIVVELRAADKLPVPGHQVDFAISSGGGSLSVLRTTTDANGRASTILTLGLLPGLNVVSVSAPGVPAITVTATATLGLPAVLDVLDASLLSITDSAAANIASALLPAITLTDAVGNVLSGIPVTFQLLGDGSLNGTLSRQVSVLTGSDGVAALTSLALGTLAGADTVFAIVAGVIDTVKFVANITNATASVLSFAQQPLNGTGGAALSTITVELRDRFGNLATTGPSASMPVTLALNGATGAILGPDASALTRTATGGIATFDVWIDKAATGYTLTASAGASVAAATSAAFDIAVGPIARLLAVAGNNQGSLVNTGLADALVVQALDAGSNVVTAGSVVFDVVSGAGTLDGGVTSIVKTLDASGKAIVSWAVGTGQQVVRAAANGVTRDLRAFVAEQLVLLEPIAATAQSGVPLAQQPRVRLLDNAGNVVRLAGAQIGATLEAADGQPLIGEATGALSVITDADGIATFAGMAVEGPTTQPVMARFFRVIGGEVEDASITPAISSAITLAPGLPRELMAVDVSPDHRVPQPGQKQLTFKTTDGYNDVPGPVVFTVVNGPCSLASPSSVESDAAGIATVSINAPVHLTSCTLQSLLNIAAPPGHQGGFRQPTVSARLYVAGDTVPVWTGRDVTNPTDFHTAGNWLDGRAPISEALSFIPAVAAPNHPKVTAPASLRSLSIENGAVLDLATSSLVLAGSFSGQIVGGGTMALTAPSSATVKGSIDALLKFGETSCPGADYDVSGSLNVSVIEVNCVVDLRSNVDIAVAGDLVVKSAAGRWRQRAGRTTVAGNARFEAGTSEVRDAGSLIVGGALITMPSARLDQAGGTITVGGDATFDGSSVFSGGVLDLKKAFSHSGDGGTRTFDASLPHITRFTGSAASTLIITWNVAQTSAFGQLEIRTAGAAGVSLAGSGRTVPITDLWVYPGALLTVPSGFTLELGGVAGKGLHVLDDPVQPGRVVNHGVVTVLNNLLCVLTGLILPGECLSLL